MQYTVTDVGGGGGENTKWRKFRGWRGWGGWIENRADSMAESEKLQGRVEADGGKLEPKVLNYLSQRTKFVFLVTQNRFL